MFYLYVRWSVPFKAFCRAFCAIAGLGAKAQPPTHKSGALARASSWFKQLVNSFTLFQNSSSCSSKDLRQLLFESIWHVTLVQRFFKKILRLKSTINHIIILDPLRRDVKQLASLAVLQLIGAPVACDQVDSLTPRQRPRSAALHVAMDRTCPGSPRHLEVWLQGARGLQGSCSAFVGYVFFYLLLCFLMNLYNMTLQVWAK